MSSGNVIRCGGRKGIWVDFMIIAVAVNLAVTSESELLPRRSPERRKPTKGVSRRVGWNSRRNDEAAETVSCPMGRMHRVIKARYPKGPCETHGWKIAKRQGLPKAFRQIARIATSDGLRASCDPAQNASRRTPQDQR